MPFTVPPANKVAGQSGFVSDIDNAYGALSQLATGNVLNATYSGGADPTGAADSTAAIQAALNAGLAYLPAGSYTVSSALSIPTGASMIGAGMNSTTITQTSTSADTLTMTDKRYITVRGLMLQGPNSGTGRGIAFLKSASALASLHLEDLRIAQFGGQGLRLETPITSKLSGIRIEGCGGDFFYLDSGTSCVLDNCYANGASVTSVNGYQLHAMSYTTLNSCACDGIVGSGAGGGAGYLINGGQSIVLNGCGNESSGLGYKVTTSADTIVFNGCEVYAETNTGLLVTSTSTNVLITGFKERLPNAATVSINISTGCTAVVINPSVTTAATYATGTSYVITSTGGTVH